MWFVGILSLIMIRILRKDIMKYNQEDMVRTLKHFDCIWFVTWANFFFLCLQEEAMEESGWKLVHGDVLRPPPNASLLAVFVASGVQLFLMLFVTICEWSREETVDL